MIMNGNEGIEQIKGLLSERLGGGYLKYIASTDREHTFYWSYSYHTQANIKIEVVYPFAAKFQYIGEDGDLSRWATEDYLGLSVPAAKQRVEEGRKPSHGITSEMIDDILEYQLKTLYS